MRKTLCLIILAFSWVPLAFAEEPDGRIGNGVGEYVDLLGASGSKICSYTFFDFEFEIEINDEEDVLIAGGDFCQAWMMSGSVMFSDEGHKARGMGVGTLATQGCCTTMIIHMLRWRESDDMGRVVWEFDGGGCGAGPRDHRGPLVCVDAVARE